MLSCLVSSSFLLYLYRNAIRRHGTGSFSSVSSYAWKWITKHSSYSFGMHNECSAMQTLVYAFANDLLASRSGFWFDATIVPPQSSAMPTKTMCHGDMKRNSLFLTLSRHLFIFNLIILNKHKLFFAKLFRPETFLMHTVGCFGVFCHFFRCIVKRQLCESCTKMSIGFAVKVNPVCRSSWYVCSLTRQRQFFSWIAIRRSQTIKSMGAVDVYATHFPLNGSGRILSTLRQSRNPSSIWRTFTTKVLIGFWSFTCQTRSQHKLALGSER